MEPFEISNSDFTEWDSALLVQHYPNGKDMKQRNNCLEQVKKLHVQANEEKISIPDDVNRILRRIETEKRLCELNEDDQNKIRQLSEISPKVRLALRTAQLKFVQKKSWKHIKNTLLKKR
ncbi:MAG: hypothetical protein GY749_38930 [Desulfobacteraceae bacterium]|nr:hypothetical protein [Desulfobacteraceae bacterium]